MQNAGSGMSRCRRKRRLKTVENQLRSARAGRSVFMLPSALVALARMRLLFMPVPDLFMSVFIESVLVDPLLFRFIMSVLDGVVRVAASDVGLFGVAFIEPVGAVVLLLFPVLGVAGDAGWFWVCGFVPVVLPVAVCAVAKPMAPIMVAAAAAVMRSFDAFM